MVNKELVEAEDLINQELAVFEFSRHPAFKIAYKEGLTDGFFGYKSGPTIGGTPMVLHEVAHAMEFGSNKFRSRFKDGSFNFKSPKKNYYRDNRGYVMVYEDWMGSSALDREIRTCAIQYCLIEKTSVKMNEEDFIEEYVTALKYMPDYGNAGKSMDYVLTEFKKLKELVTLDSYLKDFEKWLNKMQKYASSI